MEDLRKYPNKIQDTNLTTAGGGRRRGEHTRRCAARRLAAVVVLAAAVVAGLAAPTAASAATGDPGARTCDWEVAQLPRTPDAVEGWYRGCPTVRLGTPDAVEGWLR